MTETLRIGHLFRSDTAAPLVACQKWISSHRARGADAFTSTTCLCKGINLKVETHIKTIVSNNLQECIMVMWNLKMSKFAQRAALRGKMEESALHHYSIQF